MLICQTCLERADQAEDVEKAKEECHFAHFTWLRIYQHVRSNIMSIQSFFCLSLTCYEPNEILIPISFLIFFQLEPPHSLECQVCKKSDRFAFTSKKQIVDHFRDVHHRPERYEVAHCLNCEGTVVY